MTVTLALIFPNDYDWQSTRAIAQAEDNAPTDAKIAQCDEPTLEAGQLAREPTVLSDNEENVAQEGKKHMVAVTVVGAGSGADPIMQAEDDGTLREVDRDTLQRTFVRAGLISIAFFTAVDFVSFGKYAPPRRMLMWIAPSLAIVLYKLHLL
jgi:hypothetical protein